MASEAICLDSDMSSERNTAKRSCNKAQVAVFAATLGTKG